jgi:hypothetical protein
VAEEMKLGFDFTQRGMRRTFDDLARHAQIESIVTRGISGRLTEQMQNWYSTVSPAEQRESIAKVITLFGKRPKAGSEGSQKAGGAPGGAPAVASGAPNEKAG